MYVLDHLEVVAILDVLDVIGDTLPILELLLIKYNKQLMFANLEYFFHFDFEHLNGI